MLKKLGSAIGYALIVCGLLMSNVDAAAGASEPQQVMQTYLDSLAEGDTATLAGLVEGNMKERSYRLLTENPTYPDFLRSHYSDVVMTIEELTPVGPDYNARVRFDYPASDSSVSIFVLSPVSNEWKIVDEQGE
jgi:hypothetical protein